MPPNSTSSKLRNISQKILALIFVVALTLQPVTHFFERSATAASSPWTQTDWVGGSGQTSWSDSTKYDSASNVTTTTAGQATLTPSEKLTNTTFETNTTGWTATSEANGGSFSDSDFTNTSGATVAWPLDESSTTPSYARAVNATTSPGRNVTLDPGFDDSSKWAQGTGWSVSGSVLNGTSAAAAAVTSQTVPVTSGKYYKVTYDLVVTSGSVHMELGTAAGVVRSTTGTYTDNIVANGTSLRVNPTTTFTGTIDNLVVTQASIPATSVTQTQILADGDMEAAGTSSWSAGNSATLSKQTGTPHGGTQVLRVARNTTNNPYALQTVMTIGNVYRVRGYMRGDGTANPSITQGTTILNGTSSTSWQPFDITFLATATGIRFQATTSTGTQYAEFDDLVLSDESFLRTGELYQDGNMEAADTGVWIGTGTITKQTGSAHGGSNVLRVTSAGTNVFANQNMAGTGRTYRFTGYARSDGTVAPTVSDPGGTVKWTGTTSTSWQPFDVVLISTNTEGAKFRTSATGYTEWDDLTAQEVTPLTGQQLNGVVAAGTANGHLTNAYTFDGTNDVVNIYSTDFNSAFNQAEGTAVVWAKVSSAGDWTDAATRRILYIPVDSNNRIIINKTATINQLSAVYQAGGTSSTISDTSLAGSTGWFQMALTWSKGSDQVKAYINGTQVGSTQTGLGTWVGNLSATSTLIGSDSNAGGNAWKGQINDVRMYNRALTGSEIAALYSGNTFARDTTTFHGGVASAKVVTDAYNNANVTQSVNVGDTNNYNLSTYAYTNGGAVTSADVQLYYNGAAITTTYTSVGSGWYRLSAVVVGANASRTYGVQVKPSKTVYLDDFSVSNYATSGTLTSSIFDTGQPSDWGTLTSTVVTPASTTVTMKVRSSNDSAMSGATAFSSCSTVSFGADLSGASCATDNQRYVQYQFTLGTSDTSVTPTFQDLSIAFTASDSSPPTGGSVSYLNGYSATTTIDVTVSDGTDTGTGINTATRTLQRRDATLSAGTCGSYGSYATIVPTGSYPNFQDTTAANGCHQYQYLVSDNNGNQATYTSVNVVKVDSGSPTSPGTPSTTTPTNSTSQNWTWTAATDTLSSIANYLWRTTGSAITSGSTATNSVITNLTQGVYTFFVKAVDQAGNQSAETSSSVTVDTTAPSTTDNTDANWHTSAVTVTLTCNDSGGTSCASTYYTTDGSTPTTSSSQGTSINLSSDGIYTIKYFSKDTAGNSESVKTAANTVKIDSTAPSTPGSPTTTSPTTNTKPTWTWTAATDGGSGLATPAYTVQWSTDSTFLAGVSSATATSNTFTHSTDLTPGTWYFRVKAADVAGNQSAFSSNGSVIITVAVTPDTTAPTGLSLDSPGDKSYTNNQRPTFRWKAATDAGGVNRYSFELDNPSLGNDQPAGDFTINSIPPTHDTQTIETNKYTIRYENFSDADDSNNYISLTTKSSSEWGSSENDGKLREGVVNWAVKAIDNSNNEVRVGRTVFVDQTQPTTTLTQLNDTPASGASFATTDKTPTFYGRVTDPLAGSSAGQTQDDNGPKVASAPKMFSIKIEKKNGIYYTVFSEATISLNAPYFACTSQEVGDNSKQTCDKYVPFSYTVPNSLAEGTYRITLGGKDNVDNGYSENVFTLTVGSLSAIASAPEKAVIDQKLAQVPAAEQPAVKEQIEITKPVASSTPAPITKQVEKVAAQQQNLFAGVGKLFFNISSTATNVFASIIKTSGNAIAWLSQAVANGAQSIANATSGGISLAMRNVSKAFSSASIALRQNARSTADRITLSTIGFLYRFVSEPTQIYDVRVAAISPTEAKISWKTNIPANGKVNYGLNESYPLDIQSEERSTFHEFTLTNLQPNTEYHFEVMSQGNSYVYDANRRFKTPPVK